ncbi:hypothetical protein DIPPA_30479 [Diplonema papillatum]|nr:hypothetical protein DIPPA_30479 [Diplonema papillatum]
MADGEHVKPPARRLKTMGHVSFMAEGCSQWEQAVFEVTKEHLVVFGIRGKKTRHCIGRGEVQAVEACMVKHLRPPDQRSYGLRVCIKGRDVFISVPCFQFREELSESLGMHEGGGQNKEGLELDDRGFPKCLLPRPVDPVQRPTVLKEGMTGLPTKPMPTKRELRHLPFSTYSFTTVASRVIITPGPSKAPTAPWNSCTSMSPQRRLHTDAGSPRKAKTSAARTKSAALPQTADAPGGGKAGVSSLRVRTAAEDLSTSLQTTIRSPLHGASCAGGTPPSSPAGSFIGGAARKKPVYYNVVMRIYAEVAAVASACAILSHGARESLTYLAQCDSDYAQMPAAVRLQRDPPPKPDAWHHQVDKVRVAGTEIAVLRKIRAKAPPDARRPHQQPPAADEDQGLSPLQKMYLSLRRRRDSMADTEGSQPYEYQDDDGAQRSGSPWGGSVETNTSVRSRRGSVGVSALKTSSPNRGKRASISEDAILSKWGQVPRDRDSVPLSVRFSAVSSDSEFYNKTDYSLANQRPAPAAKDDSSEEDTTESPSPDQQLMHTTTAPASSPLPMPRLALSPQKSLFLPSSAPGASRTFGNPSRGAHRSPPIPHHDHHKPHTHTKHPRTPKPFETKLQAFTFPHPGAAKATSPSSTGDNPPVDLDPAPPTPPHILAHDVDGDTISPMTHAAGSPKTTTQTYAGPSAFLTASGGADMGLSPATQLALSPVSEYQPRNRDSRADFPLLPPMAKDATWSPPLESGRRYSLEMSPLLTARGAPALKYTNSQGTAEISPVLASLPFEAQQHGNVPIRRQSSKDSLSLPPADATTSPKEAKSSRVLKSLPSFLELEYDDSSVMPLTDASRLKGRSTVSTFSISKTPQTHPIQPDASEPAVKKEAAAPPTEKRLSLSSVPPVAPITPSANGQTRDKASPGRPKTATMHPMVSRRRERKRLIVDVQPEDAAAKPPGPAEVSLQQDRPRILLSAPAMPERSEAIPTEPQVVVAGAVPDDGSPKGPGPKKEGIDGPKPNGASPQRLAPRAESEDDSDFDRTLSDTLLNSSKEIANRECIIQQLQLHLVGDPPPVQPQETPPYPDICTPSSMTASPQSDLLMLQRQNSSPVNRKTSLALRRRPPPPLKNADSPEAQPAAAVRAADGAAAPQPVCKPLDPIDTTLSDTFFDDTAQQQQLQLMRQVELHMLSPSKDQEPSSDTMKPAREVLPPFSIASPQSEASVKSHGSHTTSLSQRRQPPPPLNINTSESPPQKPHQASANSPPPAAAAAAGGAATPGSVARPKTLTPVAASEADKSVAGNQNSVSVASTAGSKRFSRKRGLGGGLSISVPTEAPEAIRDAAGEYLPDPPSSKREREKSPVSHTPQQAALERVPSVTEAPGPDAALQQRLATLTDLEQTLRECLQQGEVVERDKAKREEKTVRPPLVTIMLSPAGGSMPPSAPSPNMLGAADDDAKQTSTTRSSSASQNLAGNPLPSQPGPSPMTPMPPAISVSPSSIASPSSGSPQGHHLLSPDGSPAHHRSSRSPNQQPLTTPPAPPASAPSPPSGPMKSSTPQTSPLQADSTASEAPNFNVGDRVAGYFDGAWYACKILSVNATACTCDVEWTEDSSTTPDFPFVDLRQQTTSASTRFNVGDEVEGSFDGAWFACQIQSVDLVAETCDVFWIEDSSTSPGFPMADLRRKEE